LSSDPKQTKAKVKVEIRVGINTKVRAKVNGEERTKYFLTLASTSALALAPRRKEL